MNSGKKCKYATGDITNLYSALHGYHWPKTRQMLVLTKE